MPCAEDRPLQIHFQTSSIMPWQVCSPTLPRTKNRTKPVLYDSWAEKTGHVAQDLWKPIPVSQDWNYSSHHPLICSCQKPGILPCLAIFPNHELTYPHANSHQVIDLYPLIISPVHEVLCPFASPSRAELQLLACKTLQSRASATPLALLQHVPCSPDMPDSAPFLGYEVQRTSSGLECPLPCLSSLSYSYSPKSSSEKPSDTPS